MKDDHRSYIHTQLLQLGKESLKKIPACTGFEPLTSAIMVQRSQRSRERIPYKPEFFFSGFLFTTAKVAYMRAHNMIFIYSKLH